MIWRVILFWLLSATLALADLPRHAFARLIQKDMPEGVLAYTWTPDNHVQTIKGYRRSAVTPDEAIPTNATADVILKYGWDYLGRLGSVTNGTILAAGYHYDAVGNLGQMTYDSILASHYYSYNAQNRLTGLLVSNAAGYLQRYSYSLDASGCRRNVMESNGWSVAGMSLSRSVAYEYDGSYGSGAALARVHRLTRETITNGAGTWAGSITNIYDQVGNRTSRQTGFNFTPVDALTNQTFVFDHRDLIDSDGVPNDFNTNYDANGNTLVDSGTPTGDLYDAENRLIAKGTNVLIGYDADGNRVSKTVSGSTTYYLVDDLNPTGYAQVLAEYGSLSNPPSLGYVVGQNLISVVNENTDNRELFYCYDGQGSTRMLLDGGLNVDDTYDYDANGNLLASTGSDTNNYRYTGQQWDPDLEMYYNRARYYKPSLGRFWTADTYDGDQSNPLSLHKYLYCEANPANITDPSGHGDDVATLEFSMGTMVGMAAFSAAAISEAKTHAIATLTMSAYEYAQQVIAADVEQYNANQAQMEAEIAMSTLQSMGKPLKKLIEQAEETAKKVNVVPMPRSVIPNVAAHVAAAMSKGMPTELERVDAATAAKNRRIAVAGAASAGFGKSWDEYPFASGNASGIVPDITPVPQWENSMQGGIISGCYKLEKINVGMPYTVVVLP